MNWFKQLVSSTDKEKNKIEAEKFNEISEEEITKLYKISVVSLLNRTNKNVRVSDYDFRPKDWSFRKGSFSLDQKFGANSENVMCTDIDNLLNTEIGHSTVIDLKGNSKGLHNIDVPHDIALKILYDRAVHKSIKMKILMSSYYDYIDSVESSIGDTHVREKRTSSGQLLTKKVFTEAPEFLEMLLMELKTRMK